MLEEAPQRRKVPLDGATQYPPVEPPGDSPAG
jgi:hypothetical protein